MEENNIKLTFPAIFNETMRKYGKSRAYAFVGEEPMSYDVAGKRINALSALLEKKGIRPGDKVAMLSTNMPNWGIAYFSITFMGAVVVPILPDFSVTEVANILEHSEAKAIFISSGLLNRIEGFKSENLKTVIQIEDFSLILSENNSSEYDPEAVPAGKYDVMKTILLQLSIHQEQQAVQKE